MSWDGSRWWMHRDENTVLTLKELAIQWGSRVADSDNSG